MENSQPFSRTGQPTIVFGIYDALSAKIAEAGGAEAIWLSSFSYSASQATADLGLLPFSSEVHSVSRIRAATSLPIVADIDNAYESPEAAARIVRTLANLGVDGVSIEDKKSPKFSSLYEAPHGLMVEGRFLEILHSVRDSAPTTTLMARLEGVTCGVSTSAVLRRADRCLSAGADYVIIHDTTPAGAGALELVRSLKGKPVGLIPTTYLRNLKEFPLSDISFVVFANQLLRSSILAMQNLLAVSKAAPESIEEIIAPVAEVLRLVGAP